MLPAGVAAALQTWDLIDPENSIKRDVVMQGPAASSSVKTGNAFARCGTQQQIVAGTSRVGAVCMQRRCFMHLLHCITRSWLCCWQHELSAGWHLRLLASPQKPTVQAAPVM
jgi:hypothetical protein